MMRRDQIRRPEPQPQRRLRVVHHRPRRDRRLRPTELALPHPPTLMHHADVPPTAAPAPEPIRPTTREQVLPARLLSREALLELHDRHREPGARHPIKLRNARRKRSGMQFGPKGSHDVVGLMPAQERKRVSTHVWQRTSCSPSARPAASPTAASWFDRPERPASLGCGRAQAVALEPLRGPALMLREVCRRRPGPALRFANLEPRRDVDVTADATHLFPPTAGPTSLLPGLGAKQGSGSSAPLSAASANADGVSAPNDAGAAAEAPYPRLTGATGAAGRDPLSKTAGLRICPATARCSCPAFMRTRDSGPTVPGTHCQPKQLV